MKKTILIVATLCAAALFGAQNNLMINFHKANRIDPDYYADGSEVPSGELYALVWTPKDATFAGIAADGTPVDASTGEIVAFEARCRNAKGKFELVGFEVDAAKVASKYAKGTWQVYLLDTRIYGADGKVTVGAVTVEGRPVAVNASSPVAASMLVPSAAMPANVAPFGVHTSAYNSPDGTSLPSAYRSAAAVVLLKLITRLFMAAEATAAANTNAMAIVFFIFCFLLCTCY